MQDRLYDVITFDCYGTLVDWEGGIGRAITAAAAAEGIELSHDRVISAYHETEHLVERAPYRSYREVLAETASRVARRLGWDLPAERAGFLAESLPGWLPFPDTNEALKRLVASGHKLGLLSNIDDELIARTRDHLAVPFDLVITAEQVRSYKPAHGHFLAARERLGGARWLHAAQSYFHDVVPTAELGIANAWVNRKDEEPSGDVRPLYEVGDLAGLADLLAGPAGA